MTLKSSRPKTGLKSAITRSPAVLKVIELETRLIIDKTSWFRITAFTPSDYIRERVKKGALVFVDGDVSIDKYQDEASGKTLSAIRIIQSMLLWAMLMARQSSRPSKPASPGNSGSLGKFNGPSVNSCDHTEEGQARMSAGWNGEAD